VIAVDGAAARRLRLERVIVRTDNIEAQGGCSRSNQLGKSNFTNVFRNFVPSPRLRTATLPKEQVRDDR
jgi:hypothetical protein